MYGTEPNVANVTTNGEQIVSVMEIGFSDRCVYEYDNSKCISISIKNNKITNVLIRFNEQDRQYHDYNDLTEEEKEEYIPKAEYRLVTKDALERYKADHRKKTGIICSIL